MTKLDINGNTVSKNRNYLLKVLNNLPAPKIEIDSVGRVMVETGDGGSIRFFIEDERRIYDHLCTKQRQSKKL